jgi:hypothetical protein
VAMLFDTSGEEITFTPEGGQPATMTALVGNVRIVEKITTRGRHKVSQRDLTICDSPSGPYGGVAQPLLNAVAAIGGDPWSVVEVHSGKGGTWRLVVEQQAVIERTRPEYRAR